jgi:hypothetical protein
MVQIIDNIEYHFYAQIPEEFFLENEQQFLYIIKSYNALT